MTNLTEQWRKGELKAGWYYVLLFSNEEYITFIDGNWVVDDRLIGADIKEVLAPVPSYEEWLQLNEVIKRTKASGNYPSKVSQYKARITMLTEENQQLKELLKQWVHFYPIVLYEHEDTLKTKDIIELYEKTTEVLK